MSTQSSSCSWSGEDAGEEDRLPGARPPDIIDLDKFMRGALPPPPRYSRAARTNELVVDAGAVDRKVTNLGCTNATSSPGAGPGHGVGPGSGAVTVAPGPTSCSSSGSAGPPHGKRFSHDSGLSDGSYAGRRPRRAPPVTAGAGGSSASLRAFRAVCERALRDQQAQIAHVAQLCERLTETRLMPPGGSVPTADPRGVPPHTMRRYDSSEATSSSRSSRSRDARRKDKHRAAECKTYKIIMNKLDELNTLLASRARGVVPSPASPTAPRAPSSGSVSVSDKLVSTEPTLLCALRPAMTSRAPVTTYEVVAARQERAHSSRSRSSASCSPAGGFDLDDPVHLYSQAKRLQALPASTPRARTLHVELAAEQTSGDHVGGQVGGHVGTHVDPQEMTLCALCRSYWRTLRQFLVTHILSAPASSDRVTSQR